MALGYAELQIMLVVIVIVAVLAGVVILRALTAPRRDTAKDALRERYARGEISREEYLERLKDLG